MVIAGHYTVRMLATAFTLLGTAVTWLEVIAFVLALACVACNVLEIHWGWPLAIASCALYAWLFALNRLYGEAGLQVFFAAAAAWGWWQWLFGHRGPRHAHRHRDARARGQDGGAAHAPARGARRRARGSLRIAVLGPEKFLRVLWLWAIGWVLLGVLLDTATDSDVPWLDAFPTAGSVLGQVLLGRKYLENWWIWLVVNLASIGLLSYKQLWLTAALYLVFVGMAIAGLSRWRRLLHQQPSPAMLADEAPR
jgi:nicotinamide mononucleotide transporter